MKKKITTIILLLLFIVGLSLMLYPTVSDYWNSLHTSKAIENYSQAISNLNEDEYQRILDAAADYNHRLNKRTNPYLLDDDTTLEYFSLLNFSGTGVMGYVEIPQINVALPIYHGTNDSVLQVATGHLEWTSLPVGGTGTHAVISGHRGLPSAKLFTNLDQLIEGDIFFIKVLGEILTYQVDRILIVLPEVTEPLLVDAEGDYVTLVTCTPYGVNSHRMLVRGKRIATEEAEVVIKVTSDAVQIDSIITAPIMAIPLLIVALIALSIADRIKRRHNRIHNIDLHSQDFKKK